ncbi:MAG: hypothetical protein A4E52_02310 [Pelotomaculum sp. PtaB.Bin013]|nr:MAG: hypothetical protein A4E52_02310 [Pelotomaculum sp. PtaB.Bin013]
MAGASLAVNGHVGRNGDVGSHADFLAAGHAHPVRPADNRLLAHIESVHHAVEEVHIEGVFVGLHAVIVGVFHSVAACAERLVADSGKDNGHYVTVHRSAVQAGDNAFHHLGGVRVELLGVVKG